MTKEVHAWLQTTTTGGGSVLERVSSLDSYEANNSVLSTVHPANGGGFDADGNLNQDESMYSVGLKDTVQGRGQSYIPLVYNESKAAFEALLDNKSSSRAAITNLIRIATTRSHDGPWDGVDFDIETIDDSYKNLLTQWFSDATTALHAEGLTVNITAMAAYQDSGQPGGRHVFDFAALKDIVDTITVMCYSSSGMHPNTAPGAYAFTDQVMDYVLGKGVPPAMLYVGLSILPRYIDSSTPLAGFTSYEAAQQLLSDAGMIADWYEIGIDDKLFCLKRATWADNELWVVDEETLAVHLGLADKYELAGVCFFIPGGERETVWTAISTWQAETESRAWRAQYESGGSSQVLVLPKNGIDAIRLSYMGRANSEWESSGDESRAYLASL